MAEKRNEERRLSRRDFLKNTGILAGSAALGAGFLVGCSQPTDKEAAVPANGGEKWDHEADVVVIGLGGAGASAAIEAHDNGAKVLVLEKQAEENHFTNTRMSGGVFHNPDPSGDRAARVEYIKAMMCGKNIPWKLEGEQPHVSDEMAEMFADGIMEVEKFLMAQAPELDPAGMAPGGDASFPMFPKFAEAKYGRTVRCRYIDYQKADSNLKPYEQPKLTKSSGEAFHWALVEEGIKSKRPEIEILYKTPAKRLIQADNGEIIGV
jgi:3-oxosteroid 1-dehydrogenase